MYQHICGCVCLYMYISLCTCICVCLRASDQHASHILQHTLQQQHTGTQLASTTHCNTRNTHCNNNTLQHTLQQQHAATRVATRAATHAATHAATLHTHTGTARQSVATTTHRALHTLQHTLQQQHTATHAATHAAAHTASLHTQTATARQLVATTTPRASHTLQHTLRQQHTASTTHCNTHRNTHRNTHHNTPHTHRNGEAIGGDDNALRRTPPARSRLEADLTDATVSFKICGILRIEIRDARGGAPSPPPSLLVSGYKRSSFVCVGTISTPLTVHGGGMLV